MALKQFTELLLAVWREACRHTDIAESTTSITRLLGRRMPIDAVVVRELDVRRSRLETVAVSAMVSATALDVGPVDCAPARVTPFLAWCGRGTVVHHDGRSPAAPDWALCLPQPAGSEALLGPLASPRGRQGVLVL